jgi:hypothetical protein
MLRKYKRKNSRPATLTAETTSWQMKEELDREFVRRSKRK